MKRSASLARKTPMKRGAGLARSRFDPEKAARSRPDRRSPIKPKRETPRRVERPEAVYAHGPGRAWADVRLIIYVRADGRCELCRRQLNIHNMQGHHRRPRRIGPDCACNAIALCGDCHHVEVHARPARARALGLIISALFKGRPETVPAELAVGVVLLGCDGSATPADLNHG